MDKSPEYFPRTIKRAFTHAVLVCLIACGSLAFPTPANALPTSQFRCIVQIIGDGTNRTWDTGLKTGGCDQDITWTVKHSDDKKDVVNIKTKGWWYARDRYNASRLTINSNFWNQPTYNRVIACNGGTCDYTWTLYFYSPSGKMTAWTFRASVRVKN